MKKFILLVLLVVSTFAYSQNLSLSQLMNLRNLPLDEVETFLIQKGWKFTGADEPTDDSLGGIKFVYGTDGDFSYGEAFLYRIFSYEGINKLLIQINNQNKYIEYLNAVKAFNPTLVYTGSDDGNLIKIYQGKTTTFKFITAKGSDSNGLDKTVWALTIMENEE